MIIEDLQQNNGEHSYWLHSTPVWNSTLITMNAGRRLRERVNFTLPGQNSGALTQIVRPKSDVSQMAGHLLGNN
jgi:hypothetical protein